MPTRWKQACPLVFTLLAATMGCLTTSTSATFAGLPTPVMLGQRDRVGPSTTPLAFTKVKEFEAESTWEMRQGSSSNGVMRSSYVATSESGPGALSYAAHQAAGDDASVDIRLTMVKARSYAVLGGARSKSLVAIEGDVCSVGGGK